MEHSKIRAPLNSPPHFNESNYSHWEARLMFFLKMQAERLWNLVEYRWGPPLILDAQGRSIGELKLKHKWDKVDNEGSEAKC